MNHRGFNWVSILDQGSVWDTLGSIWDKFKAQFEEEFVTGWDQFGDQFEDQFVDPLASKVISGRKRN